MATGKTPAKDGVGKGKRQPPKKTRTTSKPRAEAKPKAKPRAKPKADPVVLDPPKKMSQKAAPKASRNATSANRPDVIEAEAVDVTPRDKPKSENAPSVAKGGAKQKAPDLGKTRQPSTQVLGVGALFAGGVAVALGYFVAIKTLDLPTDNSGEIKALEAVYKTKLQDVESRITALETAGQGVSEAKLQDELNVLGAAIKEQSRLLSDRIAATETQIAELSDRANQTSSREASQNGSSAGALASGPLAATNAEIDALKQQIAALDQARTALVARVDRVEQQAGAELTAARGQARDLAKTVEQAKTGIDKRLTTERLRTAVDAGKPFAALLAQLDSEVTTAIPQALVSSAATGVASLAQLQNEFPDFARLALKTSIKAEAGPGLGSRLTAFFKAQLGARSLEPKEGDDPDAILSRAEAALHSADLTGAVTLSRQLPDGGVAAMQTWLDLAEKRLAVLAALAEFSSALGQN